MQSDDVIWQIIKNGFCSFKAKYALLKPVLAFWTRAHASGMIVGFIALPLTVLPHKKMRGIIYWPISCDFSGPWPKCFAGTRTTWRDFAIALPAHWPTVSMPQSWKKMVCIVWHPIPMLLTSEICEGIMKIETKLRSEYSCSVWSGDIILMYHPVPVMLTVVNNTW